MYFKIIALEVVEWIDLGKDWENVVLVNTMLYCRVP